MYFLSSSIRKKSTFLSSREVDKINLYHSSFIRTIPSALEFHQTYRRKYLQFVGFTTGGDFHPALKRFNLLNIL